MHASLARLLALTIALAVLTIRVSTGADEPVESRNKLSSLAPCNATLGEGWHGPSGLVVDDVNDLSSLNAEERRIAAAVAKQAIPERIIAFADFSYTRKDVPRIVTVRVFVFENADAAQAWWRKKYEVQGWETFYEKTTGLADLSVKSKELPKEMVLKDNVWITSHQLHMGDEFHRALLHYLKQITPEKGPVEAR